MAETRKCPYCAEEIPAEAVRCRYCRSRVAALDPERWYRDHPERRLAGVCAAVSHVLAVPLVFVRVGFVVLTFIHFLGPILYGILWLLLPFTPGTPSPLERGLAAAQDWVGRFGGRSPRGPAPPPEARNGGDAGHFGAGALPGGPLP
jgi:phage shock protein PspC (stress-responsive transcriptional regulator)